MNYATNGYKGDGMKKGREYLNGGTNAPTIPQYEGQIAKFLSPYADVVCYDIAKFNKKYGHLEWWGLPDPTKEQIQQAEEV
jgi:hypothetical protein